MLMITLSLAVASDQHTHPHVSFSRVIAFTALERLDGLQLQSVFRAGRPIVIEAISVRPLSVDVNDGPR